MTTKLEQALRLVHDNSTRHDWPDDIWNAIEEALAEQAEQEPVGYVPQSVIDWLSSDERTDGAYSSINLYKNPCGSSDAPLYAAPVRTKDLTGDEINELWNTALMVADPTAGNLRFKFARAVIAADREKNRAG